MFQRILSVICIVFVFLTPKAFPFDYQWILDDTPQGQETATVIDPVQVIILDESVTVADDSASLELLKQYSVHLNSEWSREHAYQLLQTFKSIPQVKNSLSSDTAHIPQSLWRIDYNHLYNDILIENMGDTKVVTIAADAFAYATPLMAEIEGVRGRYYSKRLHRAIVRFVTEDGINSRAMDRIFQDRYGVSLDIPDYADLTGEPRERFSVFKSEELIALASMFEEFPSGMLKTPGLKYLVRRLDGTSNPILPTAPAIAWTSEGYIEFMEIAFKDQWLDYVHRLILHEKAHFLWAYLFDDQLKQDWIELGGWYKNPDDIDGWSTTKQTEFVSAYAHGKNPDEDMAESISFYIVRPDLLRSRSPAKYEFIQNRIMHGTRYISQIREDLTFQVYNLYPDYVYPGKIKGIKINVEGSPNEDKLIHVEIEVHRESDLDSVGSAYTRLYSEKGTSVDISFSASQDRVGNSQYLRGHTTLSKHAANGYWSPEQIKLSDSNHNQRLESQTNFGWKLYIDNPLADCEPPQYVPNSLQLSLSREQTSEGMSYQIVTAKWKVVEKTRLLSTHIYINDTFANTYSRFGRTYYEERTDTPVVQVVFPEYMPNGIYSVHKIGMKDVAGNGINVPFTYAERDENPQTIEINTAFPDLTPPIMDVNTITIHAEPAQPDTPNGETIVNITFRVKDDISGYNTGSMSLRDPQGVVYHFWHVPEGRHLMYFVGDPTIYQTQKSTIVLPVGSVPGTWGLSEIIVKDKANNWNQYDFTEIIRFEVTEDPQETTTADVNRDGTVNIQDLVLVANAFEIYDEMADVNDDGVVNILDLVYIANQI